MPIVPTDGFIFSRLAWAFKLLPSKHRALQLPVHCRDQHMVPQDDKGEAHNTRIKAILLHD